MNSKTNILAVILLYAFFGMLQNLAGQSGICLYANSPESPDDQVQCFEYIKYEKIREGYRFFYSGNQNTIVTSYRFREIIPYPNEVSPTHPDFSKNLENYTNLVKKYPNTAGILRPKIQQMLILAETRKRLEELEASREQTNLPMNLELKSGETLENCSRFTVRDDILTVIHSGGITRINIDELNDEQKIIIGIDNLRAKADKKKEIELAEKERISAEEEIRKQNFIRNASLGRNSIEEQNKLESISAQLTEDHSRSVVKMMEVGLGSHREAGDILEARNKLAVEIAAEEEELAVAIYVAIIGTEESKEKYYRLVSELISAGYDNFKVAAARMELAGFVAEVSGKNVGSFDLMTLTKQEGVRDELIYRSRRILDARIQDGVKQKLIESTETLKIDKAYATTVGFAFINARLKEQERIISILRGGDRSELAKYVANDLKDLTTFAKVDQNLFVDSLYQFRTDQGIIILGKMANIAEMVEAFIPYWVYSDASEESLRLTIDSLRGK